MYVYDEIWCSVATALQAHLENQPDITPIMRGSQATQTQPLSHPQPFQDVVHANTQTQSPHPAVIMPQTSEPTTNPTPTNFRTNHERHTHTCDAGRRLIAQQQLRPWVQPPCPAVLLQCLLLGSLARALGREPCELGEPGLELEAGAADLEPELGEALAHLADAHRGAVAPDGGGPALSLLRVRDLQPQPLLQAKNVPTPDVR